MCIRQVQGCKRNGGLYRLLGRELLRGARCEPFGNVSELRGQLELGGGELFNYIMRVQRRSEWSQWRPVRVVCSGQVQDCFRHVGVSKLLGEHFLDGDWCHVDLSVLELRRELAVRGLERGVRV